MRRWRSLPRGRYAAIRWKRNMLAMAAPRTALILSADRRLHYRRNPCERIPCCDPHRLAEIRAPKSLRSGNWKGEMDAAHAHPGSYVEYVARSGHEAPGVHT